jgi:hypothetical protein
VVVVLDHPEDVEATHDMSLAEEQRRPWSLLYKAANSFKDQRHADSASETLTQECIISQGMRSDWTPSRKDLN